MEKRDLSSPDCWPPPFQDDKKKAAIQLDLFQATQARMIEVDPENAHAVLSLTMEDFTLRFSAENGGPLSVEHGLGIPMNKWESIPLRLPAKDTANLVNGLDKALRLELARIMVWNHVIDIIDARAVAEREMEDALSYEDETPDVPSFDFGATIPQLADWLKHNAQPEENPGATEASPAQQDAQVAEQPYDDPNDDPELVAFVNEDPRVRALYFRIVYGLLGK